MKRQFLYAGTDSRVETSTFAMPDAVSMLLDGLRLAAAFGVFGSHVFRAEYAPLLSDFHWWAGDGHLCVVVFFVISGFVIAHSTLANNRGLWSYTGARLSKLWSVLLPALAVTGLVYVVLRFATMMDFPMSEQKQWMGARLLTCAAFMNEIWFLSAAPKLNTPLWSISYEFWYYAFFAAVLFPRGTAAKLGWGFLVAILAGPKMLLLLPCWLFGVAAWACASHKSLLTASSAWLMLCGGAAGIGWFTITGWRIAVFPEPNELWFSRWFLSDWLLAVSVAFALAGIGVVASRVSVGPIVLKRLRLVSDYTFPLYVFHYPLLALGRGLVRWGPEERARPLGIALLVLLFCVVLGKLTTPFRRLLSGLMDAVFHRLGGGSKQVVNFEV